MAFASATLAAERQCSAGIAAGNRAEGDVMRFGSWRDVEMPPVATLALISSLVLFGFVLPTAVFGVNGLFLAVVVLLLTGAATAVAILRRGGARSGGRANAPDTPHHGPNMSHIPLAGLPGFLFAIGFVWMFWFGLPGFRPVVVGIAIVGVLVGGGLVLLQRRHRPPPDAHLGLGERKPAPYEGRKERT